MSAAAAAHDDRRQGKNEGEWSNRFPYNRSVHALAVVLTIAVFPLIWVGGLVTTYDAGMAVPDWPGTYGQNMFVYSAWLYGPFDLLVEHGHRLLGSLAGVLSIALVVVTYLYERRRWFLRWTEVVLAAVIAQGLLGGFRVLLDARTIAMIHGCVGPLFFAMATATAVMSSRWWLEHSRWRPGSTTSLPLPNSNRSDPRPPSSNATTAATQAGPAGGRGARASGAGLAWLASCLVGASYLQLIVGAQLRHVAGSTPSKMFVGFVHTHLSLAVVVSLLALVLAILAGLGSRIPSRVRWPAGLALGLVLVQIALGMATWVVNYALPWQEINPFLAAFTIQAKGYSESLIVTAHVATGSLIISVATVAALRAWRSSAAHRALQ